MCLLLTSTGWTRTVKPERPKPQPETVNSIPLTGQVMPGGGKPKTQIQIFESRVTVGPSIHLKFKSQALNPNSEISRPHRLISSCMRASNSPGDRQKVLQLSGKRTSCGSFVPFGPTTYTLNYTIQALSPMAQSPCRNSQP